MEWILEKSKCTGCGACKQVCSQDAILMEVDIRGFLYPKVDTTRCVGCELCQKVCPIKNASGFNENLEIYALKHRDQDIKAKSTSGGAFTLLAEKVLRENGVVYGAAYSSDWKVHHIRVTKQEELPKLRKSKYVQSNLEESFVFVQNDLENDRLVLFSGTPCQCDGLKAYLHNKKILMEKLLLCDLICHGVASPKIWRDYLKYREKKFGTLSKIDFRDKEDGWRDFKLSFTDQKGKKRKFRQNEDFYMILFFHNYSIREACFCCKYAKMQRIADYTLGDFWGAEEMYKDFSDDQGISVLLVNTSNGKEFVKSEIDKTNYLFISEEECRRKQPSLKHSTLPNPRKDEFWNDYVSQGFEYVIRKYADASFFGVLKRKYLFKFLHKIGIFSILVQMKEKLIK